VADGAYPVLATIRYAEGWDTLSVIPAVEQDDDQQVEYKYHKFRLETSSDIKTISYGGSTAISAKLYYDGELINDDYQVNWTDSSKISKSNNYYIEGGILYNINDDTFGDCLSLQAEVNFEGFTITNYLSLNLLSEVKPDRCVITKATVKASKNRDNPDDSISLSIRSIIYPTYVADDIERDKHITVEVYEENNTVLPVITRTFPINENIVQYGLDRGLEVSSVKVINDTKDKNNYFKLNSKFARHQEADIRLSGLNLSGLKESLTVKIYNSHFITVDTVTDKNEPYKSLAGDDKINGHQNIPVSLCMGVSDNIYLKKYRGRVSRGTKRNGFCNFSGTFSMVDVNSLAEKGLAFEFNDKTFYLTANEVHYFESTSVYYKFVSEKPLIVYKNGKYTFSFSCNANGVVEGKSKDALILTVKGVFDTRTGKYSLNIKDIQQDYSTDKGGLRYDIAPFEDGVITDIYNAHGYASGGDFFICGDATSL
ncbi:MAG: hypothetical protein JW745_02060, partial [Sedimentisphaerales bacterium]|nr:hypothetical protein [Sedimentisphaerales bacterium]